MKKHSFKASIITLVFSLVLTMTSLFAWFVNNVITRGDGIDASTKGVNYDLALYSFDFSDEEWRLMDANYEDGGKAPLNIEQATPGDLFAFKILVENTGNKAFSYDCHVKGFTTYLFNDVASDFEEYSNETRISNAFAVQLTTVANLASTEEAKKLDYCDETTKASSYAHFLSTNGEDQAQSITLNEIGLVQPGETMAIVVKVYFDPTVPYYLCNGDEMQKISLDGFKFFIL